MTAEIPIACTLSPDGFTARVGLIAALATDGVLERTSTETGLRVRLRDTPEIERRTRELVAAESRCCAFLTFELRRHDDSLILDISGPVGARPVIEQFFADASAKTAAAGVAWR
ncbi:hypothetical protein DVA67_021690 [Solirubrobacter sp. CPCC 204708]|uniref:Uncharacterized protein n=1 Tax=Solirubrobacter deserti TaxID=2282478 RepID=A0ABT4REU6_9ACTN|nr:hypothetical protein [Solirubrobacter deserti]MBE2318606.1 hypothetical protein [Solirubrobacter deserti]MDA0137064.1 hypothetical protein [Solirubrobacter deserti]